MSKLKSFFMRCKRVWQVMKKPSKEEFQQITKISAIGIAVIGLIGFVISLIMGVFV